MSNYQARYLFVDDDLAEYETHPAVPLRSSAIDTALIEAVANSSEWSITANAAEVLCGEAIVRRVNMCCQSRCHGG